MTAIGNALGDRFSFSELTEIMQELHGEGAIHEATADGKPRRIAAVDCIEYTRKRGLLAELFLGTAKRTDVEDRLRRQLTSMLRSGFEPFADVAQQAKAATGWLPPPSAPLAPPGCPWLETFVAEASDTVERPWVIKEMCEVAGKLLVYSRTIAPLFDRNAGQDLAENSRVLFGEFERAVDSVDQVLKRLTRPALDRAETRWAAALHRAVETFRDAIAAGDSETMRAAGGMLTSFLESTALHGEILASAPQLSFERVAVISREVSRVLGMLSTVDTHVAPALLKCDFALSYRWEIYVLWNNVMERLRDAATSLPATGNATDDAWLDDFNEKWPPAQTLARTLCLLDPDAAIAGREEELADDVNEILLAAALDETGSGVAKLGSSLNAYLDFTLARTAYTGKQLEDELDKLLALRQFLQQLRTVVAADAMPEPVTGAAGARQ